MKPSTILSHLSPRDKAIRYEAEEKRKIVGFPTAKELRQAKEVAQARLKREEEEAEKIGLVSAVVWEPALQISIHPFSETQGDWSAGTTIQQGKPRIHYWRPSRLLLLQRKVTENEDVIDVSWSYILEDTFQNFIPTGICLLQGELRQIQYSYT